MRHPWNGGPATRNTQNDEEPRKNPLSPKNLFLVLLQFMHLPATATYEESLKNLLVDFYPCSGRSSPEMLQIAIDFWEKSQDFKGLKKLDLNQNLWWEIVIVDDS